MSDVELALALADLADERSLPRFRAADLSVHTKPDLTPVTDADRAVEEAIRERLAIERPGDAIVGEEYGSSGEAARRWILDPIDGTKNFSRGLPVWATLIALEDNGVMTVGVASAPALGRRWWAARGEGAHANGERIRVSGIASIADAAISITPSRRLPLLDRLNEEFWHTRAFGDFWQHVLVAEGALEAAVDPNVSLWDVAALVPIVEEAGGRITTRTGERDPAGGSAVSTNGLIHEDVLGRLRSDPAELGRQFVDAFNAGDLDRVEAVLAPDIAFAAHGHVLPGGRAAVIDALRGLKETFAGARFELEHELAAGASVTHVLTLVGRHTGAAFGGIEPQGRDIAAHHIWIIETGGGLITAMRESWDRLGLLQQLRGEDLR